MSLRHLIRNAVRSGGMKASSVSSIVNGSFDISRINTVGISTTVTTRGLEDIIPKYPKKQEAEEEKAAPPKPTGREWKASELRKKSWDDLHKLWYVLLIERNKLKSERLAYRQAGQPMPEPSRLGKVRKSMHRIKQVMSERLKEHEDPATRKHLKDFIDAM